MSAAVTAEIPQTYDRTGDDVLAERAAEIRRLGKCVIADIIEIGRRLTECQGIVGHGNAAEAKAIEAIESGDYEEEAWLTTRLPTVWRTIRTNPSPPQRRAQPMRYKCHGY